MNQLKKKWWMFLLLAFLIIQFVRIDKSVPKTNPADDYITMTNPSPEIASILKKACYDCHSYYTRYPLYAEIAPVSWWVKGHIDHGRDELNFSIWNSYSEKRQNHKIEECVELIKNEDMPLKSYTWMHSEAQLSSEERTALASWFNQ